MDASQVHDIHHLHNLPDKSIELLQLVDQICIRWHAVFRY